MAKTESTAVNELIELVSGHQQSRPKDPEDDLMFRSPKKSVSAPRMITPVPSMRGAGDVPPLPRTRAPNGTQQNHAMPPPLPQVRLSTARPSRATSIPPLPRAAASARPPAPPARRSTESEQTIDAHVPVVQVAAPPMLAPRTSSPSMPTLDASLPRTPPVAPSVSAALPIATRTTRPSLPPPSLPIAAPVHGKPDMTSDQPWFEDSHRHPAVESKDQEAWVGTVHVPKQDATRTRLRKLVLPTIGFVLVGVFVGGFFALHGEATSKSATQASAPVALPEPVAVATAEPVAVATAEPTAEPTAAVAAVAAVAAEPVAAVESAKAAPVAVATAEPARSELPAAPVAGKPAFVDVRIDTKPQGATVMLVDRGKTTFLGTTPVSAAVDRGRTYDLVFTYAERPTQLEHLDPSATTRMSVVLGHGGRTKAAPAVKAAVTPVVETPMPKKAASKHVEASARGEGTLMISSKPPCEIYVDGKPTNLTTPQRSIALPAGSHKITLVNTAASVKKTVAVTINADKATKVIQDLMTK